MKKFYLYSFFKTLRGKLTLWYLVSIIFLFIITIFSFSFFLWATTKIQINHHLHVVINEAKQIVQDYPQHQREELLKNLVSVQGMTVVLLSPDGTSLLQTNSPDVAAVTEHQIQQVISSSKFSSEPEHFKIGDIYFATVPVNSDKGKNILAVGYSSNLLKDVFSQMLIGLGFGLFVTLLFLSMLGSRFLKKQLLPLERVAKITSSISSSQDLQKRISPLPESHELRYIAISFNNMLSKLEQVFQTEHDFFSDTAHTLKTPLAVLRSELETVKINSSQGISAEKTKKILFSRIDEISNNIQDLLLISRIQSVGLQQKEKVSLTKLVEDIAELAQLLGLEKHIKIKTKVAENITVVGEKYLLNRAIANIVKNAVEYSKNSGSIYIELTKKSGKIALKISDTGSGINREDLRHIFDRFYQGKQNNKKIGSGLGLAISKTVIESVGGKIEIKSQVNKGTQLIIHFS